MHQTDGAETSPPTTETEAHPIARRIGLIVGPLLAVAIFLFLPHDLSQAQRAVAAVGILMSTWWITEAAPLPVTSLLPVVLFPLLGAADMKAAGAPYASEIIFLFAGGLMLGLAMQRSGLHVRIALATISIVGTQPRRLIGGIMLATAVISMWVSNTATAVMMLPIGASVVDLLTRHAGADNPADARKNRRNFSVSLMLAIAYGASIGGIGTLIGTPPNTVFAGYTKQAFAQEIDFLTWMRIGIPLVAVYLPLAWAVLVFVVFPVTLREIPGGKDLIRRERAALGPPTRSEWIVLITFSCAVILWVTRAWLAKLPHLTNLTDGGIAMAAAFVLFLIPRGTPGPAAQDPQAPGGMVLDWATASRIPWGVLLLFGGGLSLGAAMTSTKLDAHIGQMFTGLGGLHPALVITILVVSVVALSELASNTAVATALMPVLGAAAVGMGIHPYLLLLPATLAASCGFMLPVATPPNTVVFASGHVTVRDMVKGGLALDLIGIVLVILLTLFLAGPLLGIDLSALPAWATPPEP